MSNRNLTGYEIPDENLSYSELKDRIIAECVRSLPAKERILLMAKKLEEDLALKDTICDQICMISPPKMFAQSLEWSQVLLANIALLAPFLEHGKFFMMPLVYLWSRKNRIVLTC